MGGKFTSLVSSVLVLLLSVSASGIDYIWYRAEPADVYWNSPKNWSPEGVPTAEDTAAVTILMDDANMPVIPPGVDATADTVKVSSDIYERHNTQLTVQGNLEVGQELVVGHWFETARGTLILEPGGTIDVTGNPGRSWIGYKCRGDFVMKGGIFRVNQLELARGDDCDYYPPPKHQAVPGTAFAYLDGGTITVNEFFTMRMGYPDCGAAGGVSWPESNGHLDVNQGTLIISADAKAQLDQYVADGWITAYGRQFDPCYPPDSNWYQPGADPNNFWMPRRASVVVDYDVRNGGRTTLTGYLAGNGEAYNLSPAFGARDVVLTPTLAWSPGDYVRYGGSYHGEPNAQKGNGHHVFIHTNYSYVNGANLNYTVGTKYGHIFGAQDTNYFSVETNYPGGALNLNTIYYWCVIEANDANVAPIQWTYKGLVQSFRTVGGRAANPNPGNGTKPEYYLDEALDVNLTWDRGYFAADVNGHDVYLGTKFNDVNDANISNDPNGVYKGRQAAQLYHLGNLKLGRTYYWRIDEVNDPCVWKGATWNFRVAPYRVVDDFGYMSDEQLLAAWKTQMDTYPCSLWTDGGDVYADQGTMQFIYDNDGGPYPGGYDYYSEAQYEYPGGEDWTQGDSTQDVKALGLSFLGAADNNDDPNYDRMYIAVEDTDGNLAMVLNDDPSAQKSVQWREWNIDLRQLSDAGVSMTTVKRVYIGFGVRCNWFGGTAGGHGTVWFDNLRLYIPRCLGTPGYRQLADLNGDCIVDRKDFDLMANDWLEKDELVTATNPGGNGLVVHYQFDETAGANAYDASGNNLTGTAMYYYKDANLDPCNPDKLYPCYVGNAWASGGGFAGGCIDLNGTFGVSAPNDVYDLIGNQVSVSVWINCPPDHPMATNWYALFNNDQSSLTAWCPTPGPPIFDWGNSVHWKCGRADTGTYKMTLTWGGEDKDFIGWNHYVFVKDSDANYMLIYHNGDLVAQSTPDIAPYPVGDANNFWIGTTTGIRPGIGGFWKGKVDDFRIYNRALTHGEVVYLAGYSSKYYPIVSPANLSNGEPMGSRRVNFKDLAVLAEEWMQSDLWPSGISP
jgi:hypothetical protein